jgi:hypothetical protein
MQTITIQINEEMSNNLTTILEEKNLSEQEYLLKALLEQLEKDLKKYQGFC